VMVLANTPLLQRTNSLVPISAEMDNKPPGCFSNVCANLALYLTEESAETWQILAKGIKLLRIVQCKDSIAFCSCNVFCCHRHALDEHGDILPYQPDESENRERCTTETFYVNDKPNANYNLANFNMSRLFCIICKLSVNCKFYQRWLLANLLNG